MKKITTQAGKFGPYQSIVELEDRYECDGSHLPFTVIGKGDISDVQDGDFPPPPPTKEQINAPILAQIATLEASVTPRRLREAVTGDSGWLAGVDAQIAALRGQLK